MNQEKIYIAGWREGLRNPDADLHWRLYRGLSLELLPARTVHFRSADKDLPLVTVSSKEANPEGFHVWFEARGRVEYHGDTAVLSLDEDGPTLIFSVRTKSLYTANDWNNWRICLHGQKSKNVRHIIFRFQGRTLGLSTQARKITDPRELLAWIEAAGELRTDQDCAFIDLIA